MTVVFWLCVSAMAYVYVGYPLLLFLVSRVVHRRVAKAPITPTVTMVIAAYNEEQAIAGKLDNSLALDYPPDRLDILVASDGSKDGTNRIVREYEAQHPGRVTLLDLPRGGKTGRPEPRRRGRQGRDPRSSRMRPRCTTRKRCGRWSRTTPTRTSAASAATSATSAKARRPAPRAGRCTGTTRPRSAAGRARSSP